MKKHDAYKGIPASHRAYVKKLVATANKKLPESELRATPQKVWELMQRQWEQARKEKAGMLERRRRVREESHEAIEKALMDLAGVRDLLGNIEQGTDLGFATETLAMLARAALEESCRNMEQSLCNLGVIKPGEFDSGWFTADGKLESEMPKADK